MVRVSAAYELARRDQIIIAAATCFSRKGFGATAMADIAAQAGLSVGALYRYFGSKEEVFLAVVAERVAIDNDAIFGALSGRGLPLDRLRRAFRGLQRLLASQSPEDARLSLELWTRAHDRPQLAECLREARQRRINAFRRVIHEAKLAGQMDAAVRPMDAVATLMVLADGLVTHRACAVSQQPSANPLAETERLLLSWSVGTPPPQKRASGQSADVAPSI